MLLHYSLGVFHLTYINIHKAHEPFQLTSFYSIEVYRVLQPHHIS